MRRRDKYTALVWFAKWEHAEGEGRMAEPAAHLIRGVSDNLVLLTRAGYLVELEQSASTYRVRLLPWRPRMPIGQPWVAWSYSGTDLPAILASAVLEVSMVRNPDNRWQQAGREIVRWVA